MRGRDSGWLLLTGSPGLGKSAIFHHWLWLREQAGLPVAFHFIRRGIHNWAEPAVVRASLAAQIERDFPEQRDAGADPAQRLEQLLHRVSPVLEERRQALVLLVDGLDEAMTLGDTDNPIPRIFPHELPDRVFVFATSRPLYPHLGWFTRRDGALRTVDLDGRPGNLATVRAFWAAMRETLSPRPGDDLVRAAVERSEGNLLHAISLHKLWRDEAKRSIETIPQGFEGTLSDHWERLGSLRREQKEIARQGLSLLCAARQALPLSVIDELLAWNEGEAEDELLPLVRGLLHEEHWHEQPAYRPFHEGVRDLVKRKLPGKLREHHHRLARFAAWPSTESGFRRDYALRHRVVHQIEAGEIEGAAASCHDVDYLTEKACVLGVVEVEREIQLTARAQEPTARKHLGMLALAVGACSHLAREVPEGLPVLLHDRLLSYAPTVHRELVWPARFRQSSPLLRHPLQNGGLMRVLTGDQGWRVTAVAVLSDGRVVSGSNDTTLRVWDVASGQTLAILAGHHGTVNAVAVLLDGRVVSGSSDKTLRVWDVASGKTLATLAGHRRPVNAVAVLPGGRVVSGSEDKTLRVWDVASGKTLATLVGHHRSVDAVAVLPGGRVVSGSRDSTLRVWDIKSGQTLATLAGHQHAVTAVAVLPGGRVVSGSFDSTLRVWDVASSQTLATLGDHDDLVAAVAVLPDGRVVSGSFDSTLRVWDVASGQTLATLAGHQDPVVAVAVLPDGRVVSGANDATLRIWDIESGQTLATLAGHHDSVQAVAMLPGGRVVSGSEDQTLRVWDVASGQTLATLADHRSSIPAVAALPGGRMVSGSFDNTLRVWDVASGQILTTLAGHQDPVVAVAVLPGGRVVSGSFDKTLRVWDVASVQTLATLAGHQGEVVAVAALPDGRVVSGSFDNTLRVWDVGSGQALATVYGDALFTSVAVVSQHLIVAGDAAGNVWFVDLP